MKTNLLIKQLAYALIATATITAVHAADVAGAWTWVTPGHNGNPDRTNTLTLKIDGATLTGKISVPGREGKIINTPIADGKVDGDTVSFVVVHENKGVSNTNSFSGTVVEDAITGKIRYVHDGTPQSRDWKASRATDNK